MSPNIIRRRVNQPLAVVFSLSLLLSSGHFADSVHAVLSAPSGNLIPPTALGQVIHSYNAPGSNTQLILIQDLHAHYGVQKNIAGILEFLHKRVPFKLAVEGASGPIDSSVMALFPDKKIKTAAADYLMKEGELSGAEYFAVVQGLPNALTGVEDSRYYNLHRELFRKTLAHRERLIRLLRNIQTDLVSLESKVYSKDLRKFQRKLKAFDAGTLQFEHVVAWLSDEAQPLGLNAGPLQRGNPDEDMGQLLSAVRTLAFEIKLQKAQTQQERNLVQVTHDLDLLVRVANLEATEQEVRFLAIRINAFVALCQSLLKSNGLTLLNEQSIRELISTGVDYYALALARNEPLIENTLALLNSQSPHTGVLVAGGFHTAAILQILRDKKISYRVITPNIDEYKTADHDLYVKRLRGIDLTPEEILAHAPRGFKKTSRINTPRESLAVGKFLNQPGLLRTALLTLAAAAAQRQSVLPGPDGDPQRGASEISLISILGGAASAGTGGFLFWQLAARSALSFWTGLLPGFLLVSGLFLVADSMIRTLSQRDQRDRTARELPDLIGRPIQDAKQAAEVQSILSRFVRDQISGREQGNPQDKQALQRRLYYRPETEGRVAIGLGNHTLIGGDPMMIGNARYWADPQKLRQWPNRNGLVIRIHQSPESFRDYVVYALSDNQPIEIINLADALDPDQLLRFALAQNRLLQDIHQALWEADAYTVAMKNPEITQEEVTPRYSLASLVELFLHRGLSAGAVNQHGIPPKMIVEVLTKVLSRADFNSAVGKNKIHLTVGHSSIIFRKVGFFSSRWIANVFGLGPHPASNKDALSERVSATRQESQNVDAVSNDVESYSNHAFPMFISAIVTGVWYLNPKAAVRQWRTGRGLLRETRNPSITPRGAPSEENLARLQRELQQVDAAAELQFSVLPLTAGRGGRIQVSRAADGHRVYKIVRSNQVSADVAAEIDLHEIAHAVRIANGENQALVDRWRNRVGQRIGIWVAWAIEEFLVIAMVDQVQQKDSQILANMVVPDAAAAIARAEKSDSQALTQESFSLQGLVSNLRDFAVERRILGSLRQHRRDLMDPRQIAIRTAA